MDAKIWIGVVVVAIMLWLLSSPPFHTNAHYDVDVKSVTVNPPTVMDNRSFSSNIVLAGKMSCHYMDYFKWRPVHSDNRPYVMLDAVNTFHRGDVLMAAAPPVVDTNGEHHMAPWRPVARVVSVMNINAFPVVVLDRPVYLPGYRIGVTPTMESLPAWNTTLLPDPIKAPFHEMTSMSRYQA